MLTPPVPCVTTVSPGFKARIPCPYSAFQAVRAAQLNVLACFKSRLAGTATRPSSPKTPYWRNVPSSIPPSACSRSAVVHVPARRVWKKRVTTLSPTWKRLTREPTASTIPAPSEPGTTGLRVGSAYWPLLTGRISRLLVIRDRGPEIPWRSTDLCSSKTRSRNGLRHHDRLVGESRLSHSVGACQMGWYFRR
jgi:hypothetical protein